MKIDRLFTQAAKDPYASLEFESRSSVIRNPDGSVVAEWKDVQVPKTGPRWLLILWPKGFQESWHPKHRRKRSEEGVPSWLQASAPDQAGAKLPADEKMVSEMMLVRSLIACPDVGRTGDTSMATSMMSLQARLSMTSFATCSPIKWWHLTLRSGSTPA